MESVIPRTKLFRGAVVLILGAVHVYHSIADTYFPWYTTFKRSGQEVDKIELAMIRAYMNKAGLSENEIQKIKVIKGNQNSCFGGPYSYPYAVLQFKENLLLNMKFDIDEVYINPLYKDFIYAQGTEYPFKKDREAIIFHELGHYKYNHAFYTSLLSIPYFGALGVFYYYPLFSIIGIGAFILATRKVRASSEKQADEFVVNTLGLAYLDAMLERHTSSSRVLSDILHRGTLRQKLLVLSELVRSNIFHVSLHQRIHHLQVLRHKLKRPVKERIKTV